MNRQDPFWQNKNNDPYSEFKHFFEEIIMNIGIDLHGTAERFPAFFSMLSMLWNSAGCGKVYLITSHSHSDERVLRECTQAGIVCDEIIRTDSIRTNPADRAKLIEELNIAVMFDDLPEYSVHFPKSCLTFHVRHHLNFDFTNKKWLFPQGLVEVR